MDFLLILFGGWLVWFWGYCAWKKATDPTFEKAMAKNRAKELQKQEAEAAAAHRARGRAEAKARKELQRRTKFDKL